MIVEVRHTYNTLSKEKKNVCHRGLFCVANKTSLNTKTLCMGRMQQMAN